MLGNNILYDTTLIISVSERERMKVIKERERVAFSGLCCVFVWVILTNGTLIYLSAIRHAAKINH